MTEEESAGEATSRIPLSELSDDLDGGSEADEQSGQSPGRSDPDPTGEMDIPTPDDADDDGSSPLSSLKRTIAERRDEADRSISEEPLFIEEDLTTVDREAVWADLLLADDDPEGLLDPSDVEDGGRYHIVSKGLCHRCEHFADPPELRCTHEGTTIHQAVDMEHYRVSECPMIDGDSTDDSGA
jgi:hypothetical protein